MAAESPTHPEYFQEADDQQHNYYFGACGLLSNKVSCQSTTSSQPVAIQTWSDDAKTPPFPADSCGALGDFSTQSCMATSAASLECSYTGGDQSRTLTIIYNDGVLAPPVPKEVAFPQYQITFTGPITGGPIADGGPSGLSWGWLTIILFFTVFLPVYLGGGYYYNYKYKEKRGKDAIPQIEYWQQVPGLVWDGCKFSYAQTIIFINYAMAKMASKDTANADPALKQALADDEGTSTSYTENKA